jgi:hypothetical protein
MMVAFSKALAPTVIGIEACGASHHWARILRSFDHEVKLIAPQLAKPYVNRGKNDTPDAEALCEAMSRPTMRFVPVKTAEQQAGGGITKKGNRYIRKLLVLSATSLLRSVSKRKGALADWISALLAKKPARLVTVALANKLARIIWAIMRTGEIFRAVSSACIRLCKSSSRVRKPHPQCLGILASRLDPPHAQKFCNQQSTFRTDSNQTANRSRREHRPLPEKLNEPSLTNPNPQIIRGIRVRRNTIMNRRIFALALSLGVAALFVPGLALAEDHLAEAISHTKEAIDHGKQGHADVLVTHAEAALQHAEAAEKAKDNSHIKEGITHLNAAIDHGKQNHADVATAHAQEALTHLEAATE